MTISVLLADDSEVVRKVIVDLLKSDPEIEVSLNVSASLKQWSLQQSYFRKLLF